MFHLTSSSSSVEAFLERREGATELARLLKQELANAPYVYTNRLVEGRVAFLEWTRPKASTRVRATVPTRSLSKMAG